MTKNIRNVETAISFTRYPKAKEVISSKSGRYKLSITSRRFAHRDDYLYIITDEDGGLVIMDSGHELNDKKTDLIEYMNEILDVKKFWQ